MEAPRYSFQVGRGMSSSYQLDNFQLTLRLMDLLQGPVSFLQSPCVPLKYAKKKQILREVSRTITCKSEANEVQCTLLYLRTCMWLGPILCTTVLAQADLNLNTSLFLPAIYSTLYKQLVLKPISFVLNSAANHTGKLCVVF